MEDYDVFVQHRLSQLKKSPDCHSLSSGNGCSTTGSSRPSVIRFYGQPILPPLLIGKRKEDMQSYEDGLKKSTVQRKSNADERMLHLQSILHSVQLRKTPTLEEFLEAQSELTPSESLQCHSPLFISQNDYALETKDNQSSLSHSGFHDREDGLTSSATHPTRSLTYPEKYQDECSIHEDGVKQPTMSPLADISHQSVSSGYLTYDNAENATIVSGRTEAGVKSLDFGSVVGQNISNTFVFHNTSNTIIKMPDIISHPPVDGEELEMGAVTSSMEDCVIAGHPTQVICQTSPQLDPATHTNTALTVTSHVEVKSPRLGISEIPHLENAELEDNSAFTQIDGMDEKTPEDKRVTSAEPTAEPCVPKSSKTTRLTNQPQIPVQSDNLEPADIHISKVDVTPSEEPYRMSLQALLKKSQEYRRQQRMLKNQAKNSKVQERAQKLLKEGQEHLNLSDKENDEFPYTITIPKEGNITPAENGHKENQVPYSQSVEASQQKSPKDGASIKEGIFVKVYQGEMAVMNTESRHFVGENAESLTREKTGAFSKNKLLYCMPEIKTMSNQKGSCAQPPSILSRDGFLIQDELYLTSEQRSTSILSSTKEIRGFHSVPSPQMCMSPVRSKSKGGNKAEGVCDIAEISKRMVLATAVLNVDNKADSIVKHGHKNSQSPTVSPDVHSWGEKDIARVLVKSSENTQQMDQLEVNLSSLKLLIRDLESTLMGNLPKCSKADDGKIPSDNCQEDTDESKHSDQNVDRCDGRPDGDESSCLEQDQSDCEWQKRRSLDNLKNTHQQNGPEPGDPKDPSLDPSLMSLERVSAAENGIENWFVTTSPVGKVNYSVILDEGRQNVSAVTGCRWLVPESKELSIMSCYGEQAGSRTQRTFANSITSWAQKIRIPDIFRKLPPDPGQCKGMDPRYQPTGRQVAVAAEGVDSSHSPSVNQSYDVGTPSGLWLLEGSEGTASASRCPASECLTPDSEGGSEGGLSKARRRLLMNTVEGDEDSGAQRDGCAGRIVRPHSSTPRASGAVQRRGGRQVDRQQVLKQTHAAQIKALQEQHTKQQQELLQALAERYSLLQSVSTRCPASVSRLGDTPTSPAPPLIAPSQPYDSLPEHYCPLLLAAAKGFLTRRLLRTEKVAQLLRTIRDTQQFLQAFQSHTPGGEFCCRQDLLLRERVTLQLRSARYEVSDIFFSLSAVERMQLISWDRELARERELRRQGGAVVHYLGKSSLSAATQKSLERKRGVMIQKKAAEWQRGTGMRVGHRHSLPSETKRGQIRPNPLRVPRISLSSRPR